MRVNANTGGLRMGLEGQRFRAKQVTHRQQQAGSWPATLQMRRCGSLIQNQRIQKEEKYPPGKQDDATKTTSPPHSPRGYLLLFYKLA